MTEVDVVGNERAVSALLAEFLLLIDVLGGEVEQMDALVVGIVSDVAGLDGLQVHGVVR